MKDAVVAKLIFDANPKAALVANSEGELTIHCFVHTYFRGPETTSSTNELELLIQTMISYFNTTSSPDDDDYPLLKVDRCGWTPLHISCFHDNSLYLVPVIFRGCPRASSIADAGELLPLHLYYIDNFKSSETDTTLLVGIFRELLSANPLAASIRNRWHGDIYALHQAAQFGSLEIVSSLYHAYPDAVRAITRKDLEDDDVDNPINYGSYSPLHCAAQNPCPIEGPKIIRFLYEKYPEAALLLPNNPESVHTPLHVVARFGASMESLKTLCELVPAALMQQDECGRTPLYHFVHSLAANRWRDCEDISENMSKLLFLLERCPEAAAIPGTYRTTQPMVPYQYAKARRATSYIQRELLRAAPEVDMAAFRDLNYAARRGAMYLLYSAIPPRGDDAKDMLLWLKLRGSADTARAAVSYL